MVRLAEAALLGPLTGTPTQQVAAIGAAAMLLREVGEDKAADAIEKSIRFVVTTKIKDLAAGKMGYSTTEVGDLVVKHL